MTENEVLSLKPECWQETSGEVFELASPLVGLISDEPKPSLFSLSFTDSVCSTSTIDLDVLEPSETFYSTNDALNQSKFSSVPTENNFTHEKFHDFLSEVEEPFEVSVPVSSEDMNKSGNNEFRKCMSMHDVSNILPFHAAAKSVNTVSCETIHSQSLSSTTKSKDSGFQRSVSCLSFTSGKRNYDHVQSKVKAYIRNIKESEALRKRNKILQKAEINDQPKNVIDEIDSVLNKEDLILQIQELKHELHEKALYIDAQRRNYNNLLLKLAEAKNTIDTLRLQRLSLNYSSVNESQNLSSKFTSINFDILEQEINKNSIEYEMNKNCSTGDICNKNVLTEEEASETSSGSLIKPFRPRKYSTPQKNKASKSLSPVSKMFSSSSRLDKNYKPLANLNKQEANHSSCSFSHAVSSPKTQLECHQCSARKSRVSSSDDVKCKTKQPPVSNTHKNSSGLENEKPSQIDVPNDDPFDKVKKWQASLPSINLLSTQSSGSETEMLASNPPGKEEAHMSLDINDVLSQELVTKCRISDVGDDASHDDLPRRFEHNLKKEFSQNPKDAKSYIKNCISPTFKPLNCLVTECTNNNSLNIKKRMYFRNKHLQFPAPLDSRNSSASESESQSFLPRSSLCTVDKCFRSNSSDSSDESSSISSSLLSPNTISSASSPTKRSKKRSALNEPKMLNKIPKLSTSKKTRTNIVLQEPKLNVILPLKNNSKARVESLQNKTTKSKTANINEAVNMHLTTESSQRKAWNSRNNANFYVCKDFCFKKSSSLQECILVMEGMRESGASIIKSALDRISY